MSSRVGGLVGAAYESNDVSSLFASAENDIMHEHENRKSEHRHVKEMPRRESTNFYLTSGFFSTLASSLASFASLFLRRKETLKERIHWVSS